MPDSVGARTRAELQQALAALEEQRHVLGDAVVDAATAGLRDQLARLAPETDAGRRAVLTVLFADLEGFTEMSRTLDPEDVRDIVGRCFDAWRSAVQEHDGAVEKFIGDAVMAVFGLHRSGEDDAVRAVRAGHAMIAALAEIADDVERRHGVHLHMRVGIDTGQVVVSTLDHRDGQFVAVGPTVNRASRLQAVAPRDMVLVSDATRRHVRGRFGLQARGPMVLKGLDTPVECWVALAERPVGFELEPAAGLGGVAVETVGRDLELLALQEHLADVADESHWRIVTILGDAGVGKSRLLRELDTWLAERPDPFWWLRGRASPSTRQRPYGVLRDMVATRFGIAEDDAPGTVLQRSAQALASTFGESPRTAVDALLLTRWLGFESGDDGPAPDPQTLNVQASDLLARYLARMSERAPVVVLLEDLHWADDASLAWLDAAVAVLRDRPVLVVATARPSLLQDRPHWGGGLTHHARLPLEPLARRHGRALLHQLLRRVEHVPRTLEDGLLDQADGNPYYLEELVTWLVDGGVVTQVDDRWVVREDTIANLSLPTTLHGLLQARLDALGDTERAVLQRAAVVGRVFWEDALRWLDGGGQDASDVGAALDRLRDAGLVQQRAVSAIEGTREMMFGHALLRDVAYESQLRSRRRERHARVAAWLIEGTRRSGRTEEVAALVAEHLDHARDPDAATWYLRAGRQAAAVHAVHEADRLLGRGLEVAAEGDVDLQVELLLEHEDVADRLGDRRRQLADLESAAGLLRSDDGPLGVRHALARARYGLAISAYDDGIAWARRAADAAARLGLSEEQAQAHLWAGKSMVWANDPAAAHELETALAIAQDQGSVRVEAETWRYLAMFAGNTGEFTRALELASRSLELFVGAEDPEGEGTALVQLSTTSYHLGRLRDARRYLEQARPVFARAGRHAGEVIVLGNLSTIAAGQGELAAALGWAQEALALNRALRDLEGSATNLVIVAEIELQLGRWPQAVEHAREGEEVARQLSTTESLQTNALAAQAHGWSSLGEHERAVALARRALQMGRVAASLRDEAIGQLVLGYVTTAAEDAATGLVAFEAAQRAYDELGVRGYATEATTARAEALRRLGRTTEAVAEIERVLDRVEESDLEGAQPEYAWLWCWQVLRDAGDDRAPGFRAHVIALLRARAARIGDDSMATEYLSRPVARALLEP